MSDGGNLQRMVVRFPLFLAVLSGVSGPVEEEVSFLAVRITAGVLAWIDLLATD